MPQEQSERRLAAILAADVVGYSRMMDTDEAGTLASLKRHRETIFNPITKRHKGRIVKLIGDGTLVEFASVVDAVNCALEIQQAINSDTHGDPGAIRLRIGINLGDVIIEGDDIYGEGVNIAARVEPLAEPGGICISAIVYESIGNRVDADFADGGSVNVKNISRPIKVWKWHPDSHSTREQAISKNVSSPSLAPEQASIAVLPFDNMSGDPEQEYFSDGITEDIITDLSKIGGLLVIARNSSFTYKGKSVDIRTVGRELGVRSVLEGSIRRAGNRVRINAQLIDATNGAHLWADRFDRELTDIFAVQDEVTRQIVDALKVTLTPAESALIADVPTKNIEAHDLFLRGREALLGSENNKAVFEFVVRCLGRAIELDPDYAEPYAGLCHAYIRDFQNKWSGRNDSKQLAARYSRLGLEKGPDLPYAHYTEALVKFWDGDLESATREIEAALTLNPNFALAIGMRGLGKIFNGAPLEGIPDLERTLRLDPVMGHQYWHMLGMAYLVAGQYQQSVDAFRERIVRSPNTDLSRGLIVSALGHLGRTDEARQVWEELKRVNPKYSFEEHIGRLPFRNAADGERIREGVAKAGIST